MKRLIHSLLVVALVVAATTTNGWMRLEAAAQPLAQPIAIGDDFSHCDACGADAVVAMTCGTICMLVMAVIAHGALAAPATQAAAWTWANQIVITANIKPEHTPPRG